MPHWYILGVGGTALALVLCSYTLMFVCSYFAMCVVFADAALLCKTVLLCERAFRPPI